MNTNRSLAPKSPSAQWLQYSFQDKQQVLNAVQELWIKDSPLKFGDNTVIFPPRKIPRPLFFVTEKCLTE